MKISRDVNGNKILKIAGRDLSIKTGFSIQTLGNLPETDRRGVVEETPQEVFNYVSLYGTKKQKTALQVSEDFTLDNIKTHHLNRTPFFRGLSDNDIEEITQLLCKGCQSAAYNEVRGALNWLSSLKSAWFFDRIMFDGGRWSYCAGQDYPREVAQIRNTLRKG